MGWSDIFAPTPAPAPVPLPPGSEMMIGMAIAMAVAVLVALVIWNYTTAALGYALQWITMYAIVESIKWYLGGNVSVFWFIASAPELVWNMTMAH